MSPLDSFRTAIAAFEAGDGELLASLATEASLLAYASARHADAAVAKRDESRAAATASSSLLSTDASPQQTASAGALLSLVFQALPPELRRARLLDGLVYESVSVAHVLFRLDWKTKGEPAREFPPEVASLVLEAGHWRLVLDADSIVGFPGYQGFWYKVPTPRPSDQL